MRAGSDTIKVRGGWRVGGPTESFVPPEPRRRIVDNAGSGDSVKVRRISLGAFGSDAPLAGSDDARFACAEARLPAVARTIIASRPMTMTFASRLTVRPP